MQTAIWAAQRLKMPIGIEGGGSAAKDVTKALTGSGIVVTALLHESREDRV
jgi:hypothetical protein